jgi:hypothetical protein
LQDQIGIVLLSNNIQGVDRKALIGADFNRQAELFPYAFSDTF